MIPNGYITIKQAAVRLGIRPNSVARRLREGTLVGIKVNGGRRWLVRESSLAWAERNGPQLTPEPPAEPVQTKGNFGKFKLAFRENWPESVKAENEAKLAKIIENRKLTKAVYLDREGRPMCRETWLARGERV